MKRILFALVGLVFVSSAFAAYNMNQRTDGGMEFEYSGDNTRPVHFTNKGDIDNYVNRVKWFDDFLGDALDARYSVNSGSDAQAVDPAISAAEDGMVRATTGDAGTGVAADGSALSQELTWQADDGDLVMEARVKISAITDVIVNIGFTDVKADTTLELPFEVGASDALTSTATDAIAFVFDTGADTDNWFCAGVDTNTDSGPTDTTVAPVADTYQKFRIEVDASGNARFFIDDAEVCGAGLASAATPTVSLTPIVVGSADTTSSRNVDMDYMFVAQDR